MLNNDPRVRAIIYYVTVVVAVVALGLKPLPFEWAQSANESLESIAAYLAALVGITAATNMTQGGDVRTTEPKP